MSDTQKINLSNSLTSDQTTDVSLGNIQIHTMKEDLKNISSGKYNPDEIIEMPNSTINKPVKQASSPFLNYKNFPSAKTPTISPSGQKISPTPTPIPETSTATNSSPTINSFQETLNPLEENLEKEEGKPESGLNLKKIFLISFAVILLFAMAAGGYYYWMLRQEKEVVIEPQPIPEVIPAEIPKTPPVVAPIFSIDKPNYLVLDIKTADAAKIKAEIKDRADKIIADSTIKTPVEFIISDSNFTPLSFNFFAGTLGMKLSTELIANLEEKFSLFIYNEEGKAKIGLLLDAKNEKLAQTQLTKTEGVLISQINPLYMDMPYTIKDKQFSNSQYGDLAVRFNNLTSDSTLSLDYAFSSKKLIIGTSKMTLRSIYDYTKNTVSTNVETTTNSTPILESTTPEIPATE